MNKRFSTLLAGLALFGAVTANAGDAVTSLKASGNGLYQLAAGDKVLSMKANGTLETVEPEAGTLNENTLWCVTVKSGVAGPIYNFQNKAVGAVLSVKAPKTADATIPAVSNGTQKDWSFYSNYVTIDEADYTNGKALYSYIAGQDSVVGLVLNGDELELKKVGADVARAGSAGLKPFILQEVDPVVLTAKQINAMSEGALIFNVDTKMSLEKGYPNPFVGFAALDADSDDDLAFVNEGYVLVANADGKILSVDTAMTNVGGSQKYYTFAWNEIEKATKAVTADSYMLGTYEYQFTFWPSKDSVAVQAKALPVELEEASATGSMWSAENTGKKTGFVTIAEFIRTYIVTIDEQEVEINMGYKGCDDGAITPDEVLLKEGLYVIKNAKGQALASPIYKNGAAYEWVTLDAQDPQHMPAYQWFVSAKGDGWKLLNREFGKEDENNTFTVSKDKKGRVVMSAVNIAGSELAETVSVQFEQITDSTILKDKHLGYKSFDEHEMMISKYKFNYLHPYSDDMFVKVNAADKVLYANATDYTAFKVEAIESEEDEELDLGYGAEVPEGDAFKGIAALERMPYYIVMNGEYTTSNSENKVVVAKEDDAAYVVPMYLKENNCYNEKHYYAVVVATAEDGKYVIANDAAHGWKVGVADDGKTANLKLQPVGETRTSAFAISIDDKPLYRDFGDNAIMKFYENVRGEYLMDESNPKLLNEGVDYAGMWTADKANGKGLGFILEKVDEGFGVKPQYLVYVNEDKEEFETEAVIPCEYEATETHPHLTASGEVTEDPAECVNAKTEKVVFGCTRGKYLISFAGEEFWKKDKDGNSVEPQIPYLDVENGYVRVGFVDAIRVYNAKVKSDILYILTPKQSAMTTEDIAKDIDNVMKKSLASYVLKGLDHKNVTWSFRYVDPEVAATAVEEGTDNAFLIESMAYDKTPIAPESAAWLKLQNGCLVLTNETSTFANTKTGGDGALVFNVEATTAEDLATSNEAIAASEVTVVAGEGVVTIAGAAGKKVVITNILGQTVANTVITSDNATVAAPAGVVVVAVEGEAAVKAVVK